MFNMKANFYLRAKRTCRRKSMISEERERKREREEIDIQVNRQRERSDSEKSYENVRFKVREGNRNSGNTK